MANYEIKYKMPTAEEWRYLRSFTEWKVFEDSAFETAAQNSVFGVSVYDSAKIIGMGRIVGDGIICFYIQDIIVACEYRHKQVGALILTCLLKYIYQYSEIGSTIALFSHLGTERFYERFGFVVREKNGKGSGMYLPYSRLQELKL